MVNNRTKGRSGENEFANLIGGKRISQPGRPGPDVEGPDGSLWEVKRIKRIPSPVRDWLIQFVNEGADALAFREDRGRWYVVTLLEWIGSDEEIL